MAIDIQMNQHLESLFRSERDRLRNADEPNQVRPKNNRKPLKGLARQLYLDRQVKLSKAEDVATSGLGLGLTKLKKVKEDKQDENFKRKK